MTIYRNIFISLFLSLCLVANSQQSDSHQKEIMLYDKIHEVIAEEHIYDQGGNLIVSKISNPSLTPYIPTDGNKSKAAVIICPGGGYSNLHIQREGYKVAEAFCKLGIAAFVLKYRLPDDEIVTDKSFVALKDAQRSIQLVRENAAEWGISIDKIGIMGFSAGGHLAATAGVSFDTNEVENNKKISLRPDFLILIYPLISFNDIIGHAGTKEILLGQNYDKNLENFFSTELRVNAETPKTILFHTGDDTIVPVENSLLFYNELLKNKIPAEMHIYSKGEHGFLSIPSFDDWFSKCINWMKVEQIHTKN